MIHTAKTVGILQAVAMTVGVALFLWSTGLPTLFRIAEAASITSASDTLSNSAPSVGSNHTISFTTPNGMISGQTIELTFAPEFTMTSIVEDDIDILVNGLSSSTDATPAANTWGVVRSGNVVTFTSPTNLGLASSSAITIRIGNHAVTSGTGANQIVNPSATTSYAIDIAGTMPDSGQVRVAIMSEVVVSASVDTSLTFTVSGVNSSSTVNGSPTTTAATTTYNTLPFGTLGINISKTLAHDLLITTNASQGYTVTVEQTGPLQSTTGDTIDGFINGSDTNTPTAWQGPSAIVSDTDTFGHWGLTSSDTNVLARSSQFGSNQWVAPSTTPIAITGHNGPVLATTTRIGFQVEISALQEAGDNYSTELRYIATPVF